MTIAEQQPLPMILDQVEVVHVERVSPAFVRVELGGACLAEFGVDAPLYDQRIKLVFPPEGGAVPSFADADDSGRAAWIRRPVEERGHMRTYTIRDVRGAGADTRLVVDLVVHPDEHGEPGPGCAWAARASLGDRVALLAPRRGHAFGGIEFEPGTARRLLLVGDETAVPAVCAILAQLGDDAVGAAFVEVPSAADVLTVPHPEGVEVEWLPRDGDPHGARLHRAVLDHLGLGAVPVEEPDEVDPDLWETPAYSSSGEDTAAEVHGAGHDHQDHHDHQDLYAWIAGESGMVTALRRALVTELGLDRRQVAFMGYWRRGVAMRS